MRTLTPGAYTAVMRGKGDTTGVGLVELYDLDPDADSRLVNIATRGLVPAARRAVARMVDSLTERDRFALLAFDNLIETPPEGRRPVKTYVGDYDDDDRVECCAHIARHRPSHRRA